MPTTITEPSIKSLFIELNFNDTVLGSGTAFIVNSIKGPLLLTARHNVTGYHNETSALLSLETAAIPNKINITHNSQSKPGEWVSVAEQLYTEEGKPRWIEHPKFGTLLDFVALPLTNLSGVRLYPYDLTATGPNIAIAPAERVSVVGFPFGLQVGGSTAIWSTGFIASESNIDYMNLPLFLIDCRTRKGQSGSPVIAHRNGATFGTNNTGAITMTSGPNTQFLGIYSGRVNEESDLGFVWKASAIKELVDSFKG